ncbi:rbcL, partial [Symbiodinium pilosum]
MVIVGNRSRVCCTLLALEGWERAIFTCASGGRQTRSSVLPTTVVPVKESRVTRKALDQSSRYADLSLDEATLV